MNVDLARWQFAFTSVNHCLFVPVTIGLAILTSYAAWTHAIAGKGALLNPVELAAVIFVLAAARLALDGRDGWAFAATTITMAASVLAIFTDLYPRVLVSSTSPAFSLTGQASGRREATGTLTTDSAGPRAPRHR